MTNTARTTPTDLQEVATRHRAARQLALRNAADTATTTHHIWRQLAAAFADTPDLVWRRARAAASGPGTGSQPVPDASRHLEPS